MITASLLALATAQAATQAAPGAPVTRPPIVTVPLSDDPVRIAAANELLDAFRLERQYDALFNRMLPVMSVQVFNGLKTNAELPQSVRTFFADPANLARAERLFATKLSAAFKRRYPVLRASTAKAYVAALTLDELRGLIAFYRTPLGQKALTVLPELQAKLMPIGMAEGERAGRDAMIETLREIGLDDAVPAT